MLSSYDHWENSRSDYNSSDSDDETIARKNHVELRELKKFENQTRSMTECDKPTTWLKEIFSSSKNNILQVIKLAMDNNNFLLMQCYLNSSQARYGLRRIAGCAIKNNQFDIAEKAINILPCNFRGASTLLQDCIFYFAPFHLIQILVDKGAKPFVDTGKYACDTDELENATILIKRNNVKLLEYFLSSVSQSSLLSKVATILNRCWRWCELTEEYIPMIKLLVWTTHLPQIPKAERWTLVGSKYNDDSTLKFIAAFNLKHQKNYPLVFDLFYYFYRHKLVDFKKIGGFNRLKFYNYIRAYQHAMLIFPKSIEELIVSYVE